MSVLYAFSLREVSYVSKVQGLKLRQLRISHLLGLHLPVIPRKIQRLKALSFSIDSVDIFE